MMTQNYAIDVETLGLESNAVILSVAVIPFSLEPSCSLRDYDYYLEVGRFFKFSVEKQKYLNRRIDRATVNWWCDQDKSVKQKSFVPYPTDLSPVEGIEFIREFVSPDYHKTIFWSRGSMDQSVLDSLCRSLDVPTIIKYNNWMDFRTAITISKETAINGYCMIKDFDDSVVLKHDPIHDCAYDIYMLLRGE